MNRRNVLKVVTTIVIAVVAVSLSFPGEGIRTDDHDGAGVCENEGLRIMAFINSSSAQEQTGRACGAEAHVALASTNFEIAPEINLHQGIGSTYLSGTGFGNQSNMNIDVRLLSNGVMSPAHTMHITTTTNGSFATDPMRIMCLEPGDQIYVLAIDRSGVEHARTFESGEFRC